jgi:tRNA(adenine34) deaminase
LERGEFPVGCVIVLDNRIIASGSRRGTRGIFPSEIDHAEILSLRKLKRFNRPALRNLSLYTTLEPCLMCFGAILLHQVNRIVYAYEDVMGGGTQSDLTVMSPLYKNQSITVIPGLLREKSIELLKRYFTEPANHYWEGSLLAKYTLAQK